MIKEINRTLNTINQKLKIIPTIPTPSKKSLQYSAIGNATIGSVLLITSLLTSSKLCALFGSLSLLSSVIQTKESQNFD